MTDEKRFATPAEVEARQERIRRGIEAGRRMVARKRAIFERWEAEGLLQPERRRRRF
jgi:hypothetical protein